MKNVKTPTSNSWQDALIESLKDPEEAAAYIEVTLEDKDPLPELLRAVIQDVIDARIKMNNFSESAKLKWQQLDKMLCDRGGDEIYTLVELLDALGFKLTVTVK